MLRITLICTLVALATHNTLQASAHSLFPANAHSHSYALPYTEDDEDYDFEQAIASRTRAAMEAFVKAYPYGTHKVEAEKYIADHKLWETCSLQNTIPSYRNYLTHAEKHLYKEEATKRLKELQEKEDWMKCLATNDELELRCYIENYPNSPNVKKAEYMLNIVRGEKLLALGDEDAAFDCLKKANEYSVLTGKTAEKFRMLAEKRNYNEMAYSTDMVRIKKYLDTTSPSSPYYTQVANHYAQLLAQQFSANSTEADYNKALLYAQDNATRDKVKQYISEARKQKKAAEKQYKADAPVAKKSSNKKRFTLGWKTFHLDYLDEAFSVGSGLRFRIGDWRDLINFTFGADYSYISRLAIEKNEKAIPEFDIKKIAHMVEIPVALKLNLLKVSRKAKFYVGCGGEYGILVGRKRLFSNAHPISVTPQIGFQSRKIDFSVHYKRYLKNNTLNIGDNDTYRHRVGFSLTKYF